MVVGAHYFYVKKEKRGFNYEKENVIHFTSEWRQRREY